MSSNLFYLRQEMLGEPFIDCPASRTNEITELKMVIQANAAKFFGLWTAVAKLDQLFSAKAHRSSLQLLYAFIPKQLRCRVEPVYDLHRRRGFRLFESLFYKSEYYLASRQALMRSAPPKTIGRLW